MPRGIDPTLHSTTPFHTCVTEISIIPYTRRQICSYMDTYSKWLGKVVGVGQLDVLVSFF